MIGLINDTHIILEDETEVRKDLFEKWVDNNGKREYCYDYEECGEHRQDAGTLTWEEYYENGIESDLREYLTVRDHKTGKLANMYDLGAGLKKLLKKI